MSRTKNVSRNIVWGMFNKVITLILPFITRTVMIYTMGMNYVGLGSLFSSILQVLSFAELGIGGALVFSMYEPIAENNDVKVCALLNLYKKSYRVIGTVILMIGLAILPFLHKIIGGDLPDDINLHFLFLIYLTNNVLGYFLFAYKQSLFTAFQRVDMISKIGMILQLVSSSVQICILVTIKNYYAYAIVIPIVTIINNIAVGILTDRVFPQYKCIGSVQKEEKKEIVKKVGGMVFQKIGTIVLASVDTIVISAFLGLRSLALYQNYYFIITALFGFLSVMLGSIIASVGNSIVSESVEKNYKDFKKFNFIYIWIVSWCAICLLCMYQPFMNIWVGQNNMFGFNMVILFVIYFFVHKWCDMLYVYQDACGIWWETRFVPLMAALVNLALNIILVSRIGLPGILISTIVAVIFIYDIGYARVLFKTYFSSIKNGLAKYWLIQVLYIITAIIVSIVTAILCTIISANSYWKQFFINGLICLFIPNFLFVLIWRKSNEFGYTKFLVRKLCGKVKNVTKNKKII